MGSSARFTLVLLLIFVLGTALLLDDKDKKKDADKEKDPQHIAMDARRPLGPDTVTPVIGASFDTGRSLVGGAPPAGDPLPRTVEYNPNTGAVRVPPTRPADPPSAPLAAGARKAVVQAGDSWWRVAKREMGSAKFINELRRANPGVEMLQPGQELVVPAASVAQAPPAREPGSAAPPDAPSRPTVRDPGAAPAQPASARLPRTHVVQDGETLWIIARLHYGKGSLWYLIADRNGLSDTDRLKTGMKVEIPAPSSH